MAESGEDMKLKVETYPHAYLVRGTHDRYVAAKELARKVGIIESAEHALCLALMPIWYQDTKCVAFYFHAAGVTVTSKDKDRSIERARALARSRAA